MYIHYYQRTDLILSKDIIIKKILLLKIKIKNPLKFLLIYSILKKLGKFKANLISNFNIFI
jgi:hypothetical protein